MNLAKSQGDNDGRIQVGRSGSCGGCKLRDRAGFSAFAGGDKIVFPEDYAKGTLYSTLDRHDNKQYRELWATPAAVEAARKGEPVASGTVLTLVQYKAQLDAAGAPAKDAQAVS